MTISMGRADLEEVQAGMTKMQKDIKAEELKRKMAAKEDFVLLDVRTEWEFEDFHIPGSVLIPYGELSERHSGLNVPKDKEIVVICRSGNRSVVACNILSRLGYANLYNVEDGIISYRE